MSTRAKPKATKSNTNNNNKEEFSTPSVDPGSSDDVDQESTDENNRIVVCKQQ